MENNNFAKPFQKYNKHKENSYFIGDVAYLTQQSQHKKPRDLCKPARWRVTRGSATGSVSGCKLMSIPLIDVLNGWKSVAHGPKSKLRRKVSVFVICRWGHPWEIRNPVHLFLRIAKSKPSISGPGNIQNEKIRVWVKLN